MLPTSTEQSVVPVVLGPEPSGPVRFRFMGAPMECSRSPWGPGCGPGQVDQMWHIVAPWGSHWKCLPGSDRRMTKGLPVSLTSHPKRRPAWCSSSLKTTRSHSRSSVLQDMNKTPRLQDSKTHQICARPSSHSTRYNRHSGELSCSTLVDHDLSPKNNPSLEND